MSVLKISMSRKLRAAAVFGLALLSSFAVARAEEVDLVMAPQVKVTATFTFKPLVEATTARLTLGEMAECHGMGQICDEAYGVDFGPSPEPGKSVTLSQGKLDVMLAKEWPDANVSAAGPHSVKIVSSFSELAEAEVLGALTTALDQQFSGSEEFKPEIEKLAINKNTKLRPAAYTIEFPSLKGDLLANPDWVTKSLSGSQRMTALCVFEDGLPPKEFSVQVTFNLKQKLPVAVRALDKGAIIKAEDLADEWTPVAGGAHKFAHRSEDLVGLRLKRPAGSFRPIEATQVEVPKIIKRGQLLKLVMKGKGLDVSGQVIAQSEAGYGQTIDAIYPATKKRLRVRVVDSATVEYVF